MNCLNGRIKVKFDVTHNKLIPLGDTGITLIRPDDWLHKNEENKTVYAENTNYLETKPQVCTVLEPNSKYPYKVGDRLFTHYMAYETAQLGDLVTQEGFIIADYVFFTILPDGSWKMTDDNYIGEQIYTPEKVTTSGLIYDIGGKKENLQVKITHLPDSPIVNIGDTVLSIDRYNYEFTIYPKKYIRLTGNEIAGVLTDAPIIP